MLQKYKKILIHTQNSQKTQKILFHESYISQSLPPLKNERRGRKAPALEQIRIILIEKHIARDYAK